MAALASAAVAHAHQRMDYWLVAIPDEETLNEILLWPPLVDLHGFVSKTSFWQPDQHVVHAQLISNHAHWARVLDLLTKNHLQYTTLVRPLGFNSPDQLVPWNTAVVRRFVGNRQLPFQATRSFGECLEGLQVLHPDVFNVIYDQRLNRVDVDKLHALLTHTRDPQNHARSLPAATGPGSVEANCGVLFSALEEVAGRRTDPGYRVSTECPDSRLQTAPGHCPLLFPVPYTSAMGRPCCARNEGISGTGLLFDLGPLVAPRVVSRPVPLPEVIGVHGRRVRRRSSSAMQLGEEEEKDDIAAAAAEAAKRLRREAEEPVGMEPAAPRRRRRSSSLSLLPPLRSSRMRLEDL